MELENKSAQPFEIRFEYGRGKTRGEVWEPTKVFRMQATGYQRSKEDRCLPGAWAVERPPERGPGLCRSLEM